MEIDEELEALVQEEIANLKKYATKGELSNLNIETFNGLDPHLCIYGQLTGYCNSPRAEELMKICCPRVYIPGDGDPTSHRGLNGSPRDKSRKDVCGLYQFWSPIEVLVAHQNIDINIDIIKQLKSDL